MSYSGSQQKASMEVRVSTLELRVGRVEADAESEKVTRADANRHTNQKIDSLWSDINQRLRFLERANWIGVGAIMGTNAVFGLVMWYLNFKK